MSTLRPEPKLWCQGFTRLYKEGEDALNAWEGDYEGLLHDGLCTDRACRIEELAAEVKPNQIVHIHEARRGVLYAFVEDRVAEAHPFDQRRLRQERRRRKSYVHQR